MPPSKPGSSANMADFLCRSNPCATWTSRVSWVALVLTLFSTRVGLAAEASPRIASTLFARTNLVAWCIVPFDAKKRAPEERAQMLERLGFRLFAYDYRAEHVPTFDAEME